LSQPTSIDSQRVRTYLLDLQDRITNGLQELESNLGDSKAVQPSAQFIQDLWKRDEGGGGRTRILENGAVFERGGVGFSDVKVNKMPASATALRPQLANRPAEAMGVSLVMHPRNPFVPTVHLNVRFLIAYDPAGKDEPIWWFGGGMDLTPYYTTEQDVKHFHQTCKNAVETFGPGTHAKLKKHCDDYFYLKHRNEARGVGGIFYDDWSADGFEASFAMMRAVGDSFLSAYAPIVQRNVDSPYTQKERDFQAYRRGRYVEFNLVLDRGTLFGLQSGGRTESILMSLPPIVNWRYNWAPEPGSAEAKLYTDFLPHKEWV
jgi:coproporphyrinogen III oxidase